MAFITSTPTNGNPHLSPFAIPRRVRRALPDFTRTVEAQLGRLAHQLDALEARVAALEAKPSVVTSDPALAARMDNIVEIVGRLEARLKLVDKRSARTRRRAAVIGDLVSDSIA
jgi:hypothetical protein